MAVQRFSSMTDPVPPEPDAFGPPAGVASGRNGLLATLSPEDGRLLEPLLEPVLLLPARTRLVAHDTPIEHAYFLTNGIASIVASTAVHRVEIGIVGREGMTGVSLTPGTTASRRKPSSRPRGPRCGLPPPTCGGPWRRARRCGGRCCATSRPS